MHQKKNKSCMFGLFSRYKVIPICSTIDSERGAYRFIVKNRGPRWLSVNVRIFVCYMVIRIDCLHPKHG
jgi:hypothetical protein